MAHDVLGWPSAGYLAHSLQHVSKTSGITAKHTEGYQITGQAWADVDGDGWLDLVVGNYERGYHLFHNEGLAKDNAWLKLKLVGDGPVNRDTVGARVIVTTADGLTQMQDVHNGSSVGGGSALELHFGLGKSKPETVEIRWPDGTQQTLTDLKADRAYEVRYEGAVVER